MTLDVAKTAHAAHVIPAVPAPQTTAAREKPFADAKRAAFAGTEEPREGDAPPDPAVSETRAAIRNSQSEIASFPTTHLSILYDSDSSQFVSRSVDNDTGEVKRQYPAESVLRRAAANTRLLLEASNTALDITV